MKWSELKDEILVFSSLNLEIVQLNFKLGVALSKWSILVTGVNVKTKFDVMLNGKLYVQMEQWVIKLRLEKISFPHKQF